MNNYVEKIRRGDSLMNFHDVELRETVDNIEDELSTDYATVEGNPINFTTLSAQTAKSTILSCEPIQDLHGYDKPWVGGAGKNLLPLTVEGIKAANSGATWTGNSCVIDNVTYTIITDNDGNVTAIKYSGTPSNNDTRFYFPNFNVQAGTIRVGGIASTGSSSIFLRIGNASTSAFIDQITLPTYKNITLSDNILLSITLRMQNMQGQLQNGSVSPYVTTDTSITTFSSYTNICPISGRTEIGISRYGKNLFDYSTCENKTINNNGLITDANNRLLSQPINVVSGTTYSFSFSRANAIMFAAYAEYDGDTFKQRVIVDSETSPTQFIPTTNKIRLLLRKSSGSASISPSDVSDSQLELGNQSSSFESFQSAYNLTISLGQTVYGGTLDVENGVLVVDKTIMTLIGDNSENWELFNQNVNEVSFQLKYLTFVKNGGFLFTNILRSLTISELDTEIGFLNYTDNTFRVYFPKSFGIVDVANWKIYLTSNPLQVVYELATPITINLTPHTINLLKGVNNISTTGDKITLTYRDGSVATLGDLLDLEKKLTDIEPYGFIEHMSILDPAQRIEYIGKNKNYKPVTVNLSGDHLANYNDWHDFFVLKENKPYMVKSDGTVDYALDPNDYTKKFDGSASDIADTTYTGGAFSWIPKIYKYEYVEGSDRYVYFSQKKLNDNYEAVGFIDENGLKHDGVWIPMFYGTEITQDNTVKIMSLATGTPSQSRDTATQKTYIENFSSQAKFFGGPIVNVLADLLIMLGKNSDIQAVFGTGNMSGGNGAQYMKANACLNGGAFYGSSTNTALNKAFHSLVLLTQNQWQRDPYTLMYKGEYIVSPYYKYDLTGASYVNTGVFVTPPSSNNWVYPNKSVSVPHWGAIPVGPYSGSTTTGWADGQYTLATQLTDTTVRVVRRFGGCCDGRLGGVCCVHLNCAASNTRWDIGASPLLLSKEKTPN